MEPPEIRIKVIDLMTGNAAMRRKDAARVSQVAAEETAQGNEVAVLDFTGIRHILFTFLDELHWRMEQTGIAYTMEFPDEPAGLSQFALASLARIKAEHTNTLTNPKQ